MPLRVVDPRALAVAILWLGAVVLLAGGCGAKPEIPAVSFHSEDWSFHGVKGSKITTDHYVLYTTCTQKYFLHALPAFMESCREAYEQLIPCVAVDPPRCEAYLFQRRRDWERFTQEFAGPRAEIYRKIRSGGYSERGVTVSHYGSRRSTLSILAHEGLHQYLEVTRGKNIPAWVNEGLACYFESFDIDERGRAVFRPELNTLRLPALRGAVSRKELIPLKDILATHAGLEVHKQSTHVSNYYAQEWALVLYLLTRGMDNPYRDGFRALLAELGTEAMDRKARAFMAADTAGTMSHGEAVFRAYVTDDLERFEFDHEVFLNGFLRMSS